MFNYLYWIFRILKIVLIAVVIWFLFTLIDGKFNIKKPLISVFDTIKTQTKDAFSFLKTKGVDEVGNMR
jgi:hypothetical protein